MAAGAQARTLIPADDGLGESWREVSFNDTGWISGTTGVGYDRNTTYLPLIATNVSAVMDNVNTSSCGTTARFSGRTVPSSRTSRQSESM